ncbi:MAG: FeoB-associated Cys-rich membrane protein [Clostridia bacterium]|nr:FeoB-associated Cys-rich membrane protein [Clostridia bacterium]
MDYIVLGIVAVIIGLALAYIIRAKKNGAKCIGCSGCSGKNCSCCHLPDGQDKQ